MTNLPNDTTPCRDQAGPVNLTEAAAGMSWTEACETLRVCHRSQAACVSIQPLGDGEDGRPNDGAFDMIYVVVSGFGVLRCEQKEMECTAGDVLFIPRGHPHRFERMDGEIRIWRIELGGNSGAQTAVSPG
jgi:mannose-6-phosphate isomerase-like protein (cupin superfamily)